MMFHATSQPYVCFIPHLPDRALELHCISGSAQGSFHDQAFQLLCSMDGLCFLIRALRVSLSVWGAETALDGVFLQSKPVV